MIFLSRIVRLALVIAMLGLTVVATGAALGPQIANLTGAVNGTAYGDISLAALEIRSEVYGRDGGLLYRFRTDGSNRELLEYEDIPEPIINTVVGIEDTAFFQHRGLNLRATFRALVENVGAGGISQGGSTITQQLVKNRVLRTDEQTVERKVREAVVSWRLEEELAKEDILEWYLNTVYFGSGAYGIQAAAEVYFEKDAAELGWPEAALLTALIPNPSRYDPFRFPEAARRQRQIVLNRLVDLGEIDQEQARFFSRLPLPNERNVLEDVAPEDYFVAEVRRGFLDGDLPANKSPELLEVIGETREERIDALFRGGLRIYTTYDRQAQSEAERARDEVLPADERGFTMALAAIEPGTGAVRSLVGGPAFQTDKFNLATQGDRQPGSSFKTFVMVTALEQGFQPNDTISGVGPCVFDNPGSVDPIYEVSNFGNSVGSVDTLTRQLTRSSNCAFVRLGQVVGIPEVIETAGRLGVNLDPDFDNNLSLPLGATEVSPLEVASAYATIAAGGVRHEPYYIERIEDRLGNVLYQHQSQGSRVLDVNVACYAAEMLEANVQGGTGTRAQIVDQPAGGKTGTTEKFSDAWFVGFTPYLATSVWMGHPDGRTPMEGVGGIDVTGGSFPAQAWGEFMTAYHDDLDERPFPECDTPRNGRPIRKDGTFESTNPCSAYPGWFPTDTTGDGVIDQCFANPSSYGYERCGAISASDGNLLERYCRPGTGGAFTGGNANGATINGRTQNVTCQAPLVPHDSNGDGVADQCRVSGGTLTCNQGTVPIDSNGDGVADRCGTPAPAQPAPQPTASQLIGQCQAGFPYGVDNDGDNRIDICYATDPNA